MRQQPTTANEALAYLRTLWTAHQTGDQLAEEDAARIRELLSSTPAELLYTPATLDQAPDCAATAGSVRMSGQPAPPSGHSEAEPDHSHRQSR